jgi:argininosuccinate lyase
MKLWGGRFEHEPSRVFERFSGSLHFDKRLFFADIQGSQAWSRALARIGIYTEEEAVLVRAALDDLAADARRDPDYFEQDDEDVHTLVLRKLAEKPDMAAAAMSKWPPISGCGFGKKYPASRAALTGCWKP